MSNKRKKARKPGRNTSDTPVLRRVKGKPKRVPRSESTQFRPGQSGNPGGRPKWSAFSVLVRAKLSEPVQGDKYGRTYAEVLFDVAWKAAKSGDLRAIEFLLDRGEGRARQSVEIIPRSESPLEELFGKMTPEQLEEKRKHMLSVIGPADASSEETPEATESERLQIPAESEGGGS
jgi:hypothetical protein